MRHFLYILGAILTYLVVGKLAEIAYFAIFPYNLADMPADTYMDTYFAGLFRRQIWMHVLVGYIYVCAVYEKDNWGLLLIVTGLLCSFNDITTTYMSIIVNIACITPMIKASWDAAQRDTAKSKVHTESINKSVIESTKGTPIESPQPKVTTRLTETANPVVKPKVSDAKKSITIGRSEACDIVIPSSSSSASRNHATISIENGRLMFTDHSSGGSIINGGMIHDRMIEIIEGDIIEIPGGEIISWDRINSILK